MAEKDIAGVGRKEVDNSVQAKNDALDDDELDSLLDGKEHSTAVTPIVLGEMRTANILPFNRPQHATFEN